ncbi:alkaline phosphatase D family protein [Aquimarina sediminis]|uniref:alkaline phosphatase D family protein n=1 Tax=Aquimarina sediminis TaxID=2070536 RepID=UPI000FFF31D3|nr:alkaline phosphatase D family protein [Aquimarina sediminis]
MKFFLQKFIVFIFMTQCFYAQDIGTRLTKIEHGNTKGVIENYFDTNLAPFYHGVASGDPLEDSVIIWTRVTANVTSVLVDWQVATDAAMTQTVKQGQVITNQDKDYTVKVDVKELSPFKTYYYQFEALGVKSIIGKTRTAPAKNTIVDNLRFAVVSCSNYQNGYFNTYNQIAERNDIDAVIHLGDYIYEYESGGYGYNDEIGRGHLPENEIITLDDYRVRYSYYRLDPMLRNVHQKHPFINIWDDHEFANDANKFGAENHNPETEGSWEVRKSNAYKAYFEWMPVRANTIEQYRLYRTISYGKLMDLIMLDTRIEGRETQISTSKNLISAASSNEEFKKYAKNTIAKKNLESKTDVKEILAKVLPMILLVSDKSNKNQNGLSKKEFNTVVNSFTDLIVEKKTTNSNSKQILELETLLKKGIVYNKQFNSKENKATYKSILGSEQFNWLKDQLSNSDAKWRIIGNQVMVMPWNGVPSNDAWDGYAEERERLLEYIKTNSINNVVVLTGDIHSTFVGEVKYKGECEMCEFVVPSITSQNLDFLGGFAAGVSEFYIKLLNKHIKDVDMDNHGYFILDVREDKVQADWFDIDDITKPVLGERRSRSWYVNTDNCTVRKTSVAAVAQTRDVNQELLNTKNPKTIISEEGLIIIGVYPNPMENEGNIHYLVNKNTKVLVSLYDLSGKMIQRLENRQMEKGIYNLAFDASSTKKGNYIVVIETSDLKVSRKISIK